MQPTLLDHISIDSSAEVLSMPSWVRSGMAALCFVSALVVVVCSVPTGRAASVASPNPELMVLQLSDLPNGFALAKSHTGPMSLAAAATADQIPASQLEHNGYVTGYVADFRREVINIAAGALEIQSLAGVYMNANGPTESLARYPKSCGRSGGVPRAVAIGDAGQLCTLTKLEGKVYYRLYALGWRYHDVRATIEVVGVAGTSISASETVTLARRQQKRIAAATH